MSNVVSSFRCPVTPHEALTVHRLPYPYSVDGFRANRTATVLLFFFSNFITTMGYGAAAVRTKYSAARRRPVMCRAFLDRKPKSMCGVRFVDFRCGKFRENACLKLIHPSVRGVYRLCGGAVVGENICRQTRRATRASSAVENGFRRNTDRWLATDRGRCMYAVRFHNNTTPLRDAGVRNKNRIDAKSSWMGEKKAHVIVVWANNRESSSWPPLLSRPSCHTDCRGVSAHSVRRRTLTTLIFRWPFAQWTPQ